MQGLRADVPQQVQVPPQPRPGLPRPPSPREPTSPVHTDTQTAPGTGGDKGPLRCGTSRGQVPPLIRNQGRSRPRSWWWWPQGILALAMKAGPLVRAPPHYKIHKWPGRDITSPTILQARLSCGDSLGGSERCRPDPRCENSEAGSKTRNGGAVGSTLLPGDPWSDLTLWTHGTPHTVGRSWRDHPGVPYPPPQAQASAPHGWNPPVLGDFTDVGAVCQVCCVTAGHSQPGTGTSWPSPGMWGP